MCWNALPGEGLRSITDGMNDLVLEVSFACRGRNGRETDQREKESPNGSKATEDSAPTLQTRIRPDVVLLCQKRPPLLENERFPHFITFPPTIKNFMKKPEKVSQINPEPAIEAAGVYPPVHEGIVTFHHHKPSALEALHTCPALYYRRRFIINATHPASNPPPMSVVPKYTNTFVPPLG